MPGEPEELHEVAQLGERGHLAGPSAQAATIGSVRHEDCAWPIALIVDVGVPGQTDLDIVLRRQIEELLGTRIYLDLHVRVAKDWQRDPKQLRKLGF